jgi:hypothetical protein
MAGPKPAKPMSTAQGCGILFAILVLVVLTLVALASTWLAGSISNSSLPTEGWICFASLAMTVLLNSE